MSTKHTPGPWRFNEATQTVVSNQSHPITQLSEPFHRQTEHGLGNDGPMLAAAPDLYEACGEASKIIGEMVFAFAKPDTQLLVDLAAKLAKALAKAEGGKP